MAALAQVPPPRKIPPSPKIFRDGKRNAEEDAGRPDSNGVKKALLKEMGNPGDEVGGPQVKLWRKLWNQDQSHNPAQDSEHLTDKTDTRAHFQEVEAKGTSSLRMSSGTSRRLRSFELISTVLLGIGDTTLQQSLGLCESIRK